MSRITIEGTYNARWSDHAATRLARAAALDGVGTAGTTQLAELGITRVVDLREAGERRTPVHPVPVVAVPLYNLPDGPPATGSLETIYDFLLQNRGAELTRAVAAIATAPGAVLVHCTAGKDRTGLVIALALLAAGHSEADVVADYALSTGVVRAARIEHVTGLLGALDLAPAAHADALRLHLDSPAEAMEHALRTLAGLGGATAYLTRHGLTPAERAALTALADSADQAAQAAQADQAAQVDQADQADQATPAELRTLQTEAADRA
jgi:protein-tyrosine phosphatase